MRKVIVSLFLVFTLCSCAHFKSIARTVRDVAHVLCCIEESKVGNPPDGMSIEEYCDIAEVIEPYIEPALAATQMAAASAKAAHAPR